MLHARLRAAAGRDRIPTDGLVAWYTMDNISGSTLVDEMGNYDGTITGATQTTGIIGQALSFSGGSDIVRVPDSSDFEFTEGFSISFWIKTSVSGNKVLIEKDGNSGWSVQIGQSGDGSIGINTGFVSAGDGQAVSSGVDLSDNLYHHVLINVESFSANGCKIYISGSEVSLYGFNDLNNPTYGSGTLDIGARYNSIAPYEGEIDQIRVYNRILSEKEIQAIYNEVA